MDFKPSQKKAKLRRAIRAQLQSLTSDEKHRASAQLCEQIVAYLAQRPAIKTIASFAALPIEPDLRALHQLLPKHKIVYPKSRPSGGMQFYHVSEPSTLVVGRYTILEPVESEQNRTSIDSIQLFLCPAFAYTNEGERLGKGGGYYDRALTQRAPNSQLLGIIFKQQLLTELLTEAHDITMDAVLRA